MESIPRSSNMYIHEDLGFEPKLIKLRESTQIVEKEISPSITSETFNIKQMVRFLFYR